MQLSISDQNCHPANLRRSFTLPPYIPSCQNTHAHTQWSALKCNAKYTNSVATMHTVMSTNSEYESKFVGHKLAIAPFQLFSLIDMAQQSDPWCLCSPHTTTSPSASTKNLADSSLHPSSLQSLFRVLLISKQERMLILTVLHLSLLYTQSTSSH